jgi:Flp pilus assembly protein TadG
MMIQRNAAGAAALLTRLAAETAGGTGVVFALALPVVLGATGLGIETGLWYVEKQRLQLAADAAALSAAYERAAGRPGAMQTAALQDAAKNGFNNVAPATFTLHNPPSSGTYAGDPSAVEVKLTRTQPALVSTLFGLTTINISARGVAMVKLTGEACVLALDPAASVGVLTQGSTVDSLNGCVVAANSTSDTAITVSGNAAMTAYSLWTAGGVSQGGSSSLSLTQPAKTRMWALQDPYADETIPASLGSCKADGLKLTNITQTLQPGTYCNGLEIGAKANITLAPGTYYIDKGDLTVNAQATLTGTNVTIVLTSSGAASQIGTVTINGGAVVNLTAPPDADTGHRGMIFFQDRRASAAGTAKLNGGATMNLFGAAYFPAQAIQFSGNNSSSSPECTQIIGRTVTFIGHSAVKDGGCPAAGVLPIQITGVKVAE